MTWKAGDQAILKVKSGLVRRRCPVQVERIDTELGIFVSLERRYFRGNEAKTGWTERRTVIVQADELAEA